jgi:hypothetical protein
LKPFFVIRFPNALKMLFRRHSLHLHFNRSEHAVQNTRGFCLVIAELTTNCRQRKRKTFLGPIARDGSYLRFRKSLMLCRSTLCGCTQISEWTVQNALVVQMFDPPRYILVCTFSTILLEGRPTYDDLAVNNSKGGRRKRSEPNLRHSSDISL